MRRRSWEEVCVEDFVGGVGSGFDVRFSWDTCVRLGFVVRMMKLLVGAKEVAGVRISLWLWCGNFGAINGKEVTTGGFDGVSFTSHTVSVDSFLTTHNFSISILLTLLILSLLRRPRFSLKFW